MTDNLGLNGYTIGGDFDSWGDKAVADFAALNSAAGDVETITTATGAVTLTQAQSNKAEHILNATLTGDLTVNVIAGIGRNWIVRNATSGAYTVTYQVVGGGGASVTIAQGFSAHIWSDGTDCYKIDLSTLSGAIAAGQIASNAVTTAKILDANVTAVKIADGGVTTAKIADSNVTADKIASNAVTAVKIADANVTTVKLAANAVTLAKLATQANNTALANVSGSAAVPSAIAIQTDDTFASASATALATSLSIKNHVAATAFSSVLPAQSGNAGKFVTTDGTNASWGDIAPANRQTFTATGTITAGKPVALLSDGTVGQIAVTAVLDNVSTALTFSAGFSASMAACYDSGSDCIIVAFQDANNSSFGTAMIGKINNGVLVLGTPVVFESASTDDISVAYDSVQDKTVISYKDVGNSGYGTAIVAEVTNGTLTFGAPVVFESATINYTATTYDEATGKIVISFSDNGNSDFGKSIVGTVGGDLISFGTVVTFESAVTKHIVSVYDPLNAKTVVAFTDGGDSNRRKAIVGSVSGSSISFGTAASAATNGDTNGPTGIAFDRVSGKVVIMVPTSAFGARGIIVGTVSGTTISFGSASTISKANNTDSFDLCFDESSGHIVVTYSPDSSGDGEADIFAVSGTSVSAVSDIEYDPGNTSRNTITYDPVEKKSVIVYREGSTGKALVLQTAQSATNADAYIGVTEDTVTDATATIAISGAVVANQTGLVAGLDYSLADDGTLTSVGTVKIGRAISATGLILN